MTWNKMFLQNFVQKGVGIFEYLMAPAIADFICSSFVYFALH